MKKFLMLCTASIFSIGLVQVVSAENHKGQQHQERHGQGHHEEEDGHDDAHGKKDATHNEKDERVEHYKAEVKTVEDAFTALDEKTNEIAEILTKDAPLEFLELENIHEISYTLEAAVDKLRAEDAAPDTRLDTLDEAVQALHYASEKQEEDKVRQWFEKLQPAAQHIKDSPTQDAKPVKKDHYTIVIKDHKFSPEELVVPAGEKIKLIVDNQDPTPEEFESHDMNREKIISGMRKATIFVGPLKPGKYHYFGEFNMDTANGYIIAK